MSTVAGPMKLCNDQLPSLALRKERPAAGPQVRASTDFTTDDFTKACPLSKSNGGVCENLL